MDQQTLTEVEQKSWTDEEIIARVLQGESALYELLVRRHNQKLYRAIRAVLKDDSEAEDVMQEAYVRAFQKLRQFEGRSSFSTWITRIGVNQAIARLNTKSWANTDSIEEHPLESETAREAISDPEREMASSETREMLEQAILRLPLNYRTVVMMRDVEEMSTAETAAALDLTDEAVKVRLHRGRAMLRRELFARVGATSATAFQFHAVRCDRVASAVMRGISDGSFQIED